MKLHFNLWRLIQLAFTLVLLWFLAQRVQWEEFQLIATDLHWGWLTLAVGLLLMGQAIGVLRWRMLAQSDDVSYNQLLVYYCAGLFANNFLPTGIGGDGVRVAMLSRDLSLTQSVLSVGLDRASGLASLSAVFVVGWLLGVPPSFKLGNLTSSDIAVALGVLTCVIVISMVGVKLFLRSSRVIQWRTHFANYRHYANWRALLFVAYGLSFLANMGIVVSNWFIMQALGIQAPFQAAVWVFLASWLALLLPIAVNGLGLVESGVVGVFALYGVPATAAFSLALINRGLMLGFGLVGGLVSLSWHPSGDSGHSV